MRSTISVWTLLETRLHHPHRRLDSTTAHSRGGHLDELLEQADAPVEVGAQADLGDDPVLVLGETAQKDVQVGRGASRLLPPRHVVQDLVLPVRQTTGHVVQDLVLPVRRTTGHVV